MRFEKSNGLDLSDDVASCGFHESELMMFSGFHLYRIYRLLI